MSTSPKALRKAAVALAEAGQPVFPCKPSGKKAKAPMTRNGFKDATLDTDLIQKWWSGTYKGAAIGVPTGILWDVLDVDVKDSADGRIHLPRLIEIGLLNGCKRVVKTPSGGWHLYFQAAVGLTNKARGSSLGLDVRARGGYVVAPPSFIDSPSVAGWYEEMGETTGSTDDPLLWDLIASSIQPMNTVTNQPVLILPSERQASVASLREWVTTLQSGERNNGLHWAVCRCIEGGIDPNELVEPALLIGLEPDEISLTINSALRRAGVQVEELKSEAEMMFPDM